jgi:hypothetical protein
VWVVVVVLLILLGIGLLSWIRYIAAVANTALHSPANFKEITAALFVLAL